MPTSRLPPRQTPLPGLTRRFEEPVLKEPANSALNDFDPTKLMSDVITKGSTYEDYIQERNEIIQRLIDTPTALGAPFPFVPPPPTDTELEKAKLGDGEIPTQVCTIIV
jgi:hypothetical protein